MIRNGTPSTNRMTKLKSKLRKFGFKESDITLFCSFTNVRSYKSWRIQYPDLYEQVKKNNFHLPKDFYDND